jgi:hypothetical protein
MSQDSNKLQRELSFIEDSFKAGIITKQEYESARKRVEDKLAAVREQELSEQEKIEPKSEQPSFSNTQEEPKLEVYHEEIPVRKPSVEQPKEEPEKEEPKKLKPIKTEKIHLETYGKKRPFLSKSTSLIILAIILLIIIAIFSFKPGQVEEKITPVCETDLDCQQPNFVGKCLNASTKYAECIFSPANPIDITIISAKDCPLCDTRRMINSLTQIYPAAKFNTLDKDEAKDMIEEHDIEVLPAYLLDNEVEQTQRFGSTKSMLIESGDYYMIKPTASGSSYFFDRKEKENYIDLFIDPFASSSVQAFDNLLGLSEEQEFDYAIRYYTRSDIDSESAEFYELKRQICIKDYSNDKFISYLRCVFTSGISEPVGSTCIEEYNIPAEKIDACIENKASDLLNKDLETAQQLSINTVPIFIFNNQYKKGGSLSVDILEENFCKINSC